MGPVADIYLELKMLCLFYFVLKSVKNSHDVWLDFSGIWETILFFPFLFLLFFLIQFQMSIDSCVN